MASIIQLLGSATLSGAGEAALIATHSGLRGRPGTELTDAVVERAVAGLVELLRVRELPLSLALARDERPEGVSLAATVAAVATARGADVVELGVVSTPAAKLAARSRDLGGAVIVTGSHLGPEQNGLKFVAAPDYLPVDPRTLPAPGLAATRGAVSSDDGADREHAAAVVASVDAEAIRRARLQVHATGGAGRAAALALEQLGCDPGPDGIGVLLDADGDRLQLVDEGGDALDPECTLPLVALARRARTVVRGADTGSTVDRLVDRVEVVPPGELHLATRLLAIRADVAGEGNGGAIVPAVVIARDGLAAAAAVLELVARSGRPLSALAAELPRRPMRRSTLPCPGLAEGAAALETVGRREGLAVGDPLEGLRVERPGGAWALVRVSATEPVLRITAEAPTEAEATALHDAVRAAVEGG